MTKQRVTDKELVAIEAALAADPDELEEWGAETVARLYADLHDCRQQVEAERDQALERVKVLREALGQIGAWCLLPSSEGHRIIADALAQLPEKETP